MTLLADHFPEVPPPREDADLRAETRRLNRGSGRRFVVLDDDPTGSQCVNDVDVVLDPSHPLDEPLREPGSMVFVLTNTRSMSRDRAVAVTEEASRSVDAVHERLGAPVTVVSRGDSTLRGHVLEELGVLGQAEERRTGRAYDAVLLAPAFPDAGRVTVDDVHYTVVDGRPVPVGETEFSRDATFGYAASDLREYVAEKSGEAVRADDVLSLSLDLIRGGGPDAVAEVLSRAGGGAYVVVNALAASDLDVVGLAVARLAARGMTFGCRAAPAMVPALAGLAPRGVLRTEELASGDGRAPHGLVVVGSHVGMTTRQVAAARARGGLDAYELDVDRVGTPADRDRHVAEVARAVTAGLAGSDVLLYTSRTLRRVDDPDESLAISRAVSRAVTEVVREVVTGRPAWVVAKGGITSHDVAERGLSVRRGRVLGQLLPGMISVVRPVEAHPDAVGMPYVVFAGNVGGEGTLADVVDVLTGRRAAVTR